MNNLVCYHTFDKNAGHVKFYKEKNIYSLDLQKSLLKYTSSLANILSCQQVHGNHIKVFRKNDEFPLNNIFINYDGIITDRNDVFLLVKHADCAPIFIFDPKKEVFGLLHSGWRGTRDKIVVEAINIMQSEFSSKTNNIKIVIGPCAHSCCYGFEKKDIHSELLNQDEWQQYINRQGKRYTLDFPGFIKNSAVKVGILDSNIEISPICTICDNRYYSWTRQRKNGEQIKNGVSIIGLI